MRLPHQDVAARSDGDPLRDRPLGRSPQPGEAALDYPTPSRPLWDLRQGDADDNRTSPHGRGWRGLAVSTALEFNYLTAAITFTLLVLVPALLVGLAPPLAITFARRRLEMASLITTRPVIAIASLVLLIVVVIWIARPLLAIALDNFWHLHYTLVFPIFVVLRELICAGFERTFHGQTVTPERLDRTRHIGTVLATLVFAGAASFVALRVGFSTQAGLNDLRNVNAAALGAAALGNAAVVLAISTLVASLFWFWTQMTSRRPVLNWGAGGLAPPSHGLRLAHLSDLHLVGERYGYRMESGTTGPCGNGRVAQALAELETIHRRRPFDRIVVTGDITDAGTRAEWVEFLQLLEGAPDLRRRLLFVPGNHDVNIVDRTNPGRLDMPSSVAQALRKLRVILAMDAIEGDCARLVDRASGQLGPCLAEFLRTGDRPMLLRELAENGSWRSRREILRVWNDLFPLVVPPSESQERCGFMLLDSTARRHFSLTNAIGVIGPGQLRAMRAVFRASRGTAWILLVHHHIVEYPIPSLGLDERIGVALVNAPDVLREIARHDTPVLVLHGHRHRDWIGTRGDMLVCSAPSVTLGDKGSTTEVGSFSLFDVEVTGNKRLQMSAFQRVAIA